MNKNVKNLVLGALFLALCLLLPFLTGQIPQIGAMISPMHIPVFLAGFVCGAPTALVVGFIAPLLRCFIFGMPPFLTAIAMSFELAAYGLVSGIMYRVVFKSKKNIATIYVSLITAMLLGRVVWGVARVVISGIGASADPFTWAAFISGAFTTAIPAIIIHLILIPAIVFALQKAKLID